MCARKQELLSMQGTKLEPEKCRVLILQRVAVSAAAELLLDEQVSTNTGPRSAARYKNQFSHYKYIWLCSSVSRVMASATSGRRFVTSFRRIFFIIFNLYEEMNQIVKNNKNNKNNNNNNN